MAASLEKPDLRLRMMRGKHQPRREDRQDSDSEAPARCFPIVDRSAWGAFMHAAQATHLVLSQGASGKVVPAYGYGEL
jgi:hypothetical protein